MRFTLTVKTSISGLVADERTDDVGCVGGISICNVVSHLAVQNRVWVYFLTDSGSVACGD